jgi:hypothetical protein
MSPLNETDVARQQARSWSEQIGNLAAELPATRPEAALTQLGTRPTALPNRLTLILNHLRQRHQKREHAADKLRAQEFVMAP